MKHLWSKSTVWSKRVVVVLALTASACAPKVGSEAWCKKMHDTPKSDWSANDVSAYAKHCVFKSYGDD